MYIWAKVKAPIKFIIIIWFANFWCKNQTRKHWNLKRCIFVATKLYLYC